MTFEIVLAGFNAAAIGYIASIWSSNGGLNLFVKMGMVVICLANVLELCHLLKF